MGHVRRRNGRWQARWQSPEGKQCTETFDRKTLADQCVVEMEAAKMQGRYVDRAGSKMTFREYAETWRQAQPHRPSTADVLEGRLRLHVYPFIGHRPLGSIRLTELQALVRDRASVMAPGTLENTVTWIRTIFKAAVADRYLGVSPANNLKLPSAEAREPVVPYELPEVEALAAALPRRLSAAVTLGAGTGLRSAEMLGLTLDRVDFLRRTLLVDRQLFSPQKGSPVFGPPKTKASRRSIPLPQVVLDGLAAHIAEFPVEDHDGNAFPQNPDRLIFTNAKGGPMKRQRWCDIWRRAVAEAGLPKGSRFHQCRHTYASLLIRAGCSVKVVQARLGHATAQETLDCYAHLWPEDDDRTREAIDAALNVSRYSSGTDAIAAQ